MSPERRFEFGKNWASFLDVLDEERIAGSMKSLSKLAGGDLAGRSFLDVGSGSGLSSLAAMRLGVGRVHSFDYDPASVACTRELRRRYFPEDPRWTVERGDALDRDYLIQLGGFDIVYSWGVLHHTGRMWSALENVAARAAPGGRLLLALYRDQGLESRIWTGIKRLYNAHPIGRATVVGVFVPAFVLRGGITDLLRFRDPRKRYREYKSLRGMSRVHDWYDWLGGWPFEVAAAHDVIEFHRRRGFELIRLHEGRGSNRNHEYTFRRTS
ncbi:MAG TPA: class I SAM-dependent methyltransferase [Candidatus Eisenbacteria bacterium]